MVIRIHGLGDVGLHRLAFITAFVYSHTGISQRLLFYFYRGFTIFSSFSSLFSPPSKCDDPSMSVLGAPPCFQVSLFPLADTRSETEPIEPWQPHPREKMKKKGLTRDCKPPIDKASPGQEGSQERPHKVVVKERSSKVQVRTTTVT
jgi:hypothetical protein